MTVDSEEITDDSEQMTDDSEEEEVVSTASNTRDFYEIDIVHDSFVLEDNNLTIYMYLYDENHNRVSDPSFEGNIKLSLEDTSVGYLSIANINKDKFENGFYQLVFAPTQTGTTALNIEFEDYELETEINVIEEVKSIHGFEVDHDGEFVINVPETITIRAIDEDGNRVPAYNVSGKATILLNSGEGTFDEDTLKKTDFEYGEATITFTPTSSEDVIIRARNGAINGVSKVMEGILFSDVDSGHKYYKSIKYLKESDIVGGYPDGSFKPDNTVSRVEALKMIFEAIESELSDGSNLTFPDVDGDQWYADYIATAKVLGVVSGYPDGTFKPADNVNKVEFVKMLLNAADIDVDPVVTADPYKDVDNLSWFAPFVNYVKETNMMPITGSSFEPDSDMTRGEVAETIYRLLSIEHNGADEYSVLLSMD